jgi:hypothetical protein
MPNSTGTTQGPNDVLASEITDALVAAGLIKEAHRAQLLAKLKAGSVKQEDWYLWIDMATDPEVTGEVVDHD